MPVMPALFQRTARRAGSASVLLLIAPLLLGADNDNDLRAIEEEAKRQAMTLNLGLPPVDAGRPADSAAFSVDDERLPTGLDAAAFARALREGSPAIFAFYQRLDAAGQQRVYQSYQNDNRLSNVSAQIAQALSNGSGNRKP